VIGRAPATGALLPWRAGGFELTCGPRTLVMGILNVTPDSFSDGGRFLDAGAAVAQGLRMIGDGADLIDVGGESTRPGAAPVDGDEEAARIMPVIRELVAGAPTVPISVDTRKAAVARAAIDAGASIVNDVSGGFERQLLDLVGAAGAGFVVMHMRGTPATMQAFARYEDVVADVRSELALRYAAAREAGIEPERIVLDPGIGFAKTAGQSLVLMRAIRAFAELGRPLLVGPSRKSFIGKVLGGADVGDRLEGTLAAVAWLAASGVQIVRVHDVKEAVRVCRTVEAIRDAEPGHEPGGEP
jgi:dihydropteroate synthase